MISRFHSLVGGERVRDDEGMRLGKKLNTSFTEDFLLRRIGRDWRENPSFRQSIRKYSEEKYVSEEVFHY